MELRRIDVHHHLFPPPFVDSLAKIGIAEGGGMPFPNWSIDSTLDVMDRAGISTAMLSISSPGIYHGDIAATIRLARECNEYSAGVISRHPRRFGGFAVLPLPDAAAALDEVNYALDVLHLDGVVLLTNYGEHYLGDVQFEPLYAELDRRRATVFVHPKDPTATPAAMRKFPTWMFEFLAETTRTVADLIYAGIPERYPHIRFILSHAGGTLPYAAGRLALFEQLSPAFKATAPQGCFAYLARMYFDTALSTSAATVNCLKDVVPSGHVLFGTDYPYASGELVRRQAVEVDALAGLTAEDKSAITHGNAEVLFPTLRR